MSRHLFTWVLFFVGFVFLGLIQRTEACELCDNTRKYIVLDIVIDATGDVLIEGESVVSYSSEDIEILYERLINVKQLASSEKRKLCVSVIIEESSLYERYILVLDTLAKANIGNSYIGTYLEEEGYPSAWEEEPSASCRDGWIYKASVEKFSFCKYFVNSNKPRIPRLAKVLR
ncbi:MAG: hypothetical protein LBV12_08050 [Puniceicoccales bacterium]|nr:hypothetical protein [Puniceicoccales bacterium]